MNKELYIVATIKPWNIEAFKNCTPSLQGKWILVESPEALETQLKSGVRPRYIFFPHWSWIVPEKIYKNYECVCFHMTDVPYGRGGSPLQNLIIQGHKSTQLTALKMIGALDAGPVYLKRPLTLNGKARDIFEKVSVQCYELIREIITREPEPVPQEGEVVLFKRRTPAQSALPTDFPIDKLYDFIRMLDAESYPKAFLEHGHYRLEFSDATVSGNANELTATVTIKYRNK